MRISSKLSVYLIALVACCLMTSPGFSANLEIKADTRRLSLDSQFDVLEDKSGQLSIQDVVQPGTAHNFKALKGNLNVSYTRSVYWLRFSLQKTDITSASEWWLEVSPVMLDDIQLYQVSSDGQIEASRAGDRQHFSAQEMQLRLPTFRLHLNDHQSKFVYLRIQTTSSLFLRAKLFTPQSYAEESNFISNLMGVYYGAMLAMIAYNLILMLSFRDRTMFYYLLLSLSILFAGLSVNGHIGQYFAQDWPWFVDITPGLCVPLIILFDSLFITHFLQLPKRMPHIATVFRVIQVLSMLAALVVLVGYNHVVAPSVQLLGFLQIFLILPICVLSARRGYRPGWIVFFATIAWIAGAMMVALRNLGMIESSWFADFGFQIGSAIEIILLALAQADKINIIKQERALAQHQLLSMAQKAEQELESKVLLRTGELADAVQRLKQLDKEKNEFLGIASHDLKNPLTSIIGMSDLLRKLDQQIEPALRHSYLERISKSGHRMMHIITNLLDVNAIETGYSPVALQTVSLHKMLQEIVPQFEAHLKEKNLDLLITADATVNVMADANATVQIIDNLLSNAIKYSLAGRHIWITISAQAELGRIVVKDEGPGLSEEDQQHLFEKFTRLSTRPTAGEHSSGLGLSIVKKLSEAMGGHVHCESVEGQGCTFTVDLPVAKGHF
ncbi:sensor histidine kinase [Undibacterium sp. RuTC16W]|uniref:sensor histidine kinase n=1 Tax=Undibacterium sp. RuTC16W TaxID=3413048 RepID=UPI003BF16525